jgi:hypothetical protein
MHSHVLRRNTATTEGNGRVGMDLTRDQQRRVLAIARATPWGDTAASLSLIDEALARAMDASRDEFVFWEEKAHGAGFTDEFSVGEASSLSVEWRFALVARLLRSIAMAYGVGTGYSGDRIGQVILEADVAATPLRELLAAVTPSRDQNNQPPPQTSNIEAWDGDVEELRNQEERLLEDMQLCDRIFSSYTVALTVTDNAGATGSASKAVNPIGLTAHGYKQNGLERVDLSWNATPGATFDVYRNGAKIAAVQAGAYTDNINRRGSGTYSYKVCAAGVSVCSNGVTVGF